MPLRRTVCAWRRGALALLACGILGLGVAGAAQCTLTTGNVNLGTYNPLAALPTTGAGSVSVSCVKTLGDVLGGILTVPYTLGLSGTPNATTPRTLTGPLSSTLNLFVYTSLPAGTGLVWGTGAGGTEVMNGQAALPSIVLLGNAVPVTQVLPYTLSLPAGQRVRSGTYTGTLTVTLSF